MENISQATTPNCSLSPLGHIQASLIADFFSNIDVKHIFSSPFRRAIQTASPLADAQNVPIVLVPEMSEIFTEFNGAPLKQHYPWEISSQITMEFPYSQFRDQYVHDPSWWPVQWPETFEHVRQRTSMFYDHELRSLCATDNHVVVFGHGASTDTLKQKVCSSGQYPVVVDTNAVIFEYHIDAEGICLHNKMHIEFLGEYASPKCTAYGEYLLDPLK